MKSLVSKKSSWLMAAVMMGAAGLTGCSNESVVEEQAPVNPTYNGESVKTQFAINIPYANPSKRMTGDNTQESNNFLGMYDIKLIPMTGSPTDVGSPVNTFTSILNLTAIGTGDITDSSDNTHVYTDVNVPVGSKNFLFYAAGGTDAPGTADEMFNEGVIVSNVTGSSVDNISFQLRGAQVADADNQQTALLAVLNAVQAVSDWKGSTNSTLKNLYDNFITLQAGSAQSILKTLENLYNSVDNIAKTGSDPDKTVAGNIQTAIKTNNTFTVSGASPYTLSTTLTYPRNINMPDGSAILSFSEGTGFSYNTTNPAIGAISNIKMADICYPASIYYFVNTPLKASDTEQDAGDWPATLTDWGTAFADWGDEVTVSTRAIALKDPIQYGVARLQLTAKCASALLTDSKNNNISIPADGFKITGVLIGGQPSKAKWNLNPADAATFDKVIYDKSINGTVSAGANTFSGTNYTLCLDNYTETAKEVNIAIEIENEAADFYGKDEKIIPKGTKFYLVAKLDPAGQTVSGVATPYVFMQDYTTTANLTIKSLQNAYNVIPDLRATQLSLGLAVDLTWKAGITFDNVVIE